jgi:hypothetical protein
MLEFQHLQHYCTLTVNPPILFVPKFTATNTPPTCCHAFNLITTSPFLTNDITTGSIEILVELETNMIGCFNTQLYLSQLVLSTINFNSLVSHFFNVVVTSHSILIFHSLKNFLPVSSNLVSSSLIVEASATLCSSFISCFTSCFVSSLTSSFFSSGSTFTIVSTLLLVSDTGILLIFK